MKEVNKKAQPEATTTKRIIDGSMDDGNEVVSAVYDEKLYPNQKSYDCRS